MKTTCAFFLGLSLLAVSAFGQDRPKDAPAGDVEVRLYIIHKDRKPVDFADMAAGLAVRHSNGKAKTLMMTLVPAGSPDAIQDKVSAIRDLGTAHFAEFFVISPVAPPQAKAEPSPAPAPPPPAVQEVKKTPTLTEWRRDHVHRGPYFRVVLPAADVPAKGHLSATVRMGDLSRTTRRMPFPFDKNDAAEAVIGRIETALKTISGHVDKMEFGKIQPVVVQIQEDLDKLAGLDSGETGVDLEYERRWCLEMANRIDKTSYSGDDDINLLLKVFEIKLNRIRSGLKLTAAKPVEPEKKIESK